MARKLKEATPEDEAGAGHNLTDDAFYEHTQAIVKANAALEVARANRQAVRKLAKAAGVELGILDAKLKMAEWEPSEIRSHYATDARYAELLRLPVGTQLDLLEGVPEAARPDIDWQSRGFLAATTKLGVPGQPPADVPADQVQNWMQGWQEGQEKNARPLNKAA